MRVIIGVIDVTKRKEKKIYDRIELCIYFASIL